MRTVHQAKTLEHGLARLSVAGCRVRYGEAGVKIEDSCEIVMTPPITLDNGDVVFAVDIRPEMMSKIPGNDTPNYSCLWRADLDAGTPEPEWDFSHEPPVFETPLDENGDPLPQVEVKYRRGCPRFA